MPTIKESETKHEYDYCAICGDYVGDIFLCGIGMICTECFSKEAGIDEEDVFFDKITEDDRDNARHSILNKIIEDEFDESEV